MLGLLAFKKALDNKIQKMQSLDSWRKVNAINSDGTFLGSKYAIQAMKSSGAESIINISSRSGLVGIPGASAYAASKVAVRNHTKTAALYCCHQDIQFDAILYIQQPF